MRYVIIGNSAAGIGAVEAIREVDQESDLTVISDEPETAYSRALISYELAGWIEKGRLDLRSPDFYKKNKVEIRLGQRAVKINAIKKTIQLDSDDQVHFDKLLLAVGGSPQKTGVKGEDKKGVFGFRTYGDLLQIYDTIKDAKEGIVLGGGCVGLQAASGLHHHNVKTHVVITSPHLLSQVADPECGDYFQELFENHGIQVKTGLSTSEFKGGERVESVLFNDGTELPAQVVITGKGVKPNTELTEGTGIKVDWGIKTDNRMQTDEADIYAAGDVVVSTDRVSNEETVNAVWPCAYEQGRVAGFNMAGAERIYDGSMRMNAADFFGVSFISIGIVKPKGEGYEMHSHFNRSKGRYWKLVFKGNALVGAVLIGKVDGAGVLHNLMRKRVDISDIKDDLLAGHYEYAKILPLVRKQGDDFKETEYEETLL
ncbi:FAD-dependent oxidoreductase [candidate division LCP-89 bacterium B3_LCP]|uniref:FAD-dependent oxidoreductase n=1 Tax=candidate division LCP-89 bacterium B3_LCP TaxID=2012998 RepID=A0A532UPM8_UNCL8|nr:MAG: FAD-dependent oxidoreductase [candidate division LCP-89 bacterium B3_LCP]